MNDDSNSRLVYSTDGSHKRICQICHEDPCHCRKVVPIRPQEVEIRIRLEKKGRGGKSVTVLFNFPYNPRFFNILTKQLKNTCGSGGTFKEDQIELQGDQRSKSKAFLEKLGFRVKFTGG